MASHRYQRVVSRLHHSLFEQFEDRMLLTAAPVILKISDAVFAGNSFMINGGGIDPATVDVAIAAESSDPIFQADFNGTGTGVGGGGNITTSGGTSALGTTTGVTNTISSTAPFSAVGGSYLNSSVALNASQSQNIATFTPTSAANSWSALVGSVKIGSYSYLTMNGGFDLFLRPNSFESGSSSWFRPVDVGGGGPLRLIFNGTGSNGLQLVINAASSILSTSPTFATTSTSTSSLTGSLAYLTSPFTLGATEHIGFTFNTSLTTGQVTMSVYAVAGTGAIDTTATTNLLGTQSFYINAASLGANPLPTGAWTMTERSKTGGNYGTATSIDYDTVRLYNTTPGVFNGLATALPANVITQADLGGAGTATGPGNIVQSGGTGALGTGTGVSTTISTLSPFTAGSDSYVNSSLAVGAANASSVATITPASAANSWAALIGTPISANGFSYLNINGGFDLFVRPNATETGTTAWFRPVDIGGGSYPMRLIFNGAGSGGGILQLELKTTASALSSVYNFATTTTDSFSLPGALSVGSPFSLGSITHLGFTFNTSPTTGLITVNVYSLGGTGTIDTTSATNRLATQSFYANAATIGANPLPNGAWTITERTNNGSTFGAATSIDYDSVRIYNSTPTSFAGLPLSAPPTNALHPTIVQTDSNGSAFVVATMPSGLAPGVYDVWVKNSGGWSSGARMNVARALDLSDYQASNGITIEITGRNFDQSEFGGTTATQVRLNDGSGHYLLEPITSLNPYNIAFTVTGATVGTTYFVEVSNDNGVTWSRPTGGQTLAIVSSGS
ncbi:MAG: hypothetical protein WCI73_08485, partial [Phycisphaerae bacterium]